MNYISDIMNYITGLKYIRNTLLDHHTFYVVFLLNTLDHLVHKMWHK